MDNKENINNNSKEESGISPKHDPETLHTPDPQEKMKGPISSPMHGIGGAFDSDESRQHANEKREKHM